MVNVLAPLVPPTILGIEVVEGVATVTWSAVVGHTYELEYTAGCQATNWLSIPPAVVATSSTVSVTNVLEAAPGARFYRVRSAE
jgi:hypothetical protein